MVSFRHRDRNPIIPSWHSRPTGRVKGLKILKVWVRIPRVLNYLIKDKDMNDLQWYQIVAIVLIGSQMLTLVSLLGYGLYLHLFE